MTEIKLTDWVVEFDVDYTHRTFRVKRVLNQSAVDYGSRTTPHTFVRAADELGAFSGGVTVMRKLGFSSTRD